MKWNSTRKRKQTEMRLEMTLNKKGGEKSNHRICQREDRSSRPEDKV